MEQLKEDLIRLAIRGYRLYFVISKRLAGGASNVKQLADLMMKPGLVQIVNKKSARHILPMALIYDYPLDTNANPNHYTLCSTFLEAFRNNTKLEKIKCFQGNCPSMGSDIIICPSGFWGYRHQLGMPISIANAPNVPPEVVYQRVPQFTVGVSTDPTLILRKPHERKLKSMYQRIGWNYADNREKVRKILKKSKSQVVYFYCHGGVINNVPYIQVGAPNERGITPDNLLAWDIRWDDPRPLVFINGCHTTALEPEFAIEFVSGFVENANASGVIGTEITVFEPLACAFAEEFLQHFLLGVPIGEAVRRARLSLLKTGNPLGMVYIPFAIGSLHLVERTERVKTVNKDK